MGSSARRSRRPNLVSKPACIVSALLGLIVATFVLISLTSASSAVTASITPDNSGETPCATSIDSDQECDLKVRIHNPDSVATGFTITETSTAGGFDQSTISPGEQTIGDCPCSIAVAPNSTGEFQIRVKPGKLIPGWYSGTFRVKFGSLTLAQYALRINPVEPIAAIVPDQLHATPCAIPGPAPRLRSGESCGLTVSLYNPLEKAKSFSIHKTGEAVAFDQSKAFTADSGDVGQRFANTDLFHVEAESSTTVRLNIIASKTLTTDANSGIRVRLSRKGRTLAQQPLRYQFVDHGQITATLDAPEDGKSCLKGQVRAAQQCGLTVTATNTLLRDETVTIRTSGLIRMVDLTNTIDGITSTEACPCAVHVPAGESRTVHLRLRLAERWLESAETAPKASVITVTAPPKQTELAKHKIKHKVTTELAMHMQVVQDDAGWFTSAPNCDPGHGEYGDYCLLQLTLISSSPTEPGHYILWAEGELASSSCYAQNYENKFINRNNNVRTEPGRQLWGRCVHQIEVGESHKLNPSLTRNRFYHESVWAIAFMLRPEAKLGESLTFSVYEQLPNGARGAIVAQATGTVVERWR